MKKIKTLKWRLFLYMMIFVCGILGLFWLFEIAFISNFYESTKIREVEDVSEELAKVINDNYLDNYVSSLSRQKDVCIRVITSSKDSFANAYGYCRLNDLSYNDVFYYTVKAKENGGTYLFNNNEKMLYLEPENGNIFLIDNKDVKDITYVKIVDNDGLIIVNTLLTPLSTTIKTLETQLFIVAGIVIIATIVLVLILNKRIVNPIEKINSSAKDLSQGRYSNKSNFDYQEANELNQTLRNAANEITKADQAKRDLIANVSHDLRTPLTMISGYGQLMIDFPEEISDKNIQVIIDEADRLNCLVNDLLDFAKLEDEKLLLHKEVFNISQLVKQIIHEYTLVKRDFKINVSIEDDLFVYADKKRIQQVIHNFIANAINYGNNKDIEIDCCKKDNEVMVMVSDHGDGIREEDLPNIWDRYYKVDKTHQRFSVGSGIGLAIAKEILVKHQAVYGVDSIINDGSKFYFKLPLQQKSQ